MFKNLNSKERQILDLFELEETENYYDLKHDLWILDPTNTIVAGLVYKGYLNANVTMDEKGNCDIQYDYSINKHKLTDYALECYGLKYPERK